VKNVMTPSTHYSIILRMSLSRQSLAPAVATEKLEQKKTKNTDAEVIDGENNESETVVAVNSTDSKKKQYG